MRYAVGILDYADRHKASGKLVRDAQGLVEALARYGALQRVLDDRIIEPRKKMEVVSECLAAQGTPAGREFMRALPLIVDNRRERLLGAICANIVELVRRRRGLVEVQVTTAMEMGEELRKTMKLRLEMMMKCGVELVERVDPSIIGGYILRWDTYMLDRSLAGKLKKTENSLYGQYQG